MALLAFTLFHVLLSLVAIATGFFVLYGLLSGRQSDGVTKTFLWTSVATSVTGFLFPVEKIMPAHAVGIVSLVVLAFAILGRYRFGLAGGWRRTYAITAGIALYLNFFVLVVQLFQKVPALHEMAPTQSEPPFQIAQLVTLAAFVVLIVLATVKSGRQGTATAS